jgi:hypothetical protein
VEVHRFVRGLAPIAAVALLAAPGVARPGVLGSAAPPWDPPTCRDRAAAAGVPASTAWYRLDGVLDASGTLAGQRLTLGLIGGRARMLALPPESFASGPVGGRVLVGDDDGSRSRVRLLDVPRGCATEIATESAVIRGGLLSPDLGTIWEHRVDRGTRADLGVWRRSTTTGAATRVLAGLTADDRHGPTFATELRRAPDGRLAVSSCGELACRTRIVDPASGQVDAVDATGPALGVVDGGLLAYSDCPGYPCPALEVDPATGRREVVEPAAGPAAVAGIDDATLVIDDGDALVILDVRGRGRRLVGGAAGLTPVRGGSGASSGADLPPGWVLLAAGGRLGDPSTARALDARASAAHPLTEVRP